MGATKGILNFELGGVQAIVGAMGYEPHKRLWEQ